MDPCPNTVYQRRQPEKTPLYQAVEDHLESFILSRAQEGRDLPAYVIKEFREFLKCGRLEYGLVIVSCSDCQAHYPVALSCKKRGFCSSCCAKRMNETTLHLVENVLPHAPYRQYVMSVPPVLRYWMGTSRALARKVHKIVVSEIDRYYRDKAKTEFGIEEGDPGGISFTQLSGSALNYNYHWLLLYLDGIYSNEASPKLTRITTLSGSEAKSILEKIVKRSIRLCKRHKLLDENAEVISHPDPDSLFRDNALLGEAMNASISSKIAFGERAGQEVRKIGKSFGYESEVAVAKGELCYSQNGFSLHAATAIGEFSRKRLEQLIRYISRPPVASTRLKKRSDGTYSYKLKTPWDNGKTTHVQFSGE